MAKFKSRWAGYTVQFLDADDEVVEAVDVRPRDADILATERQMGEGIEFLNARGTAELSLRITWNAFVRMGRAVGDFEEYAGRVDVEKLVDPPVLPDGLPDPNPSGAALSSESESPSPS